MASVTMKLDRYPEYHLRQGDLLTYLKKIFPDHKDKIVVTKVGTEYQLTIPEELSKSQRNHIATSIRYTPDDADD